MPAPPVIRRRALLAAGALLPLAAPTRAQALKAAMLLPGSINDQSWNAQGHAGLLALKAQRSPSPRTSSPPTMSRRCATMPAAASPP